MNAFEVAVVGSGPAGAATALQLAVAGRSVLLLGRPDHADRSAGEVLAPEIGPLLMQLGVWERFLAGGPRPAHAIWSAWGEERLVSKDFIAGPYGPAWRVDRSRFDAMLRSAAVDAGVRSALSLGRVDVAPAGDRWRVTSGLESAECRFVVDATGRAAAVARSRGARRRSSDQVVALIALLAPREGVEVSGEDVLLIESAADGWWYSSVLPSGELAAAFVTEIDSVRDRARPPIDAWSRALSETRFTALRAAGFAPRDFHVRLAGPGRLDRACGPGWVAVGDAASSVDPLSGIGIAKALQGAIAGSIAVNDALAGRPHALELYADRLSAEFSAALRIGSDYYRLERRWPEARFWQARHKNRNIEGDSSWPTKHALQETSST